MIEMTEKSQKFLEKNLPETLKLNSCRDILRLLYDFINQNGFAPPHYHDYNDLGREAQKVYDDIYYQNCQKQN